MASIYIDANVPLMNTHSVILGKNKQTENRFLKE